MAISLLGYHLKIPPLGAVAVELDPATIAFQSAITANSGAISAATLNAVDTHLVRGSKADGLLITNELGVPTASSKIQELYPMVGDFNGCLVKLFTTTGQQVLTNIGFGTGDYSETTGLDGDGSSYLRTGYIPSTHGTLNNSSMGVYTLGGGAANGGVHMAAFQNIGRVMRLDAPFTSGTIFNDLYNVSDGRVSVSSPTAQGLICGSRLSATAHSIYVNGTSVASKVTGGGAMPTIELYLFARNNNGAADNAINQALGGAFVGLGLTAADVNNLNARWVAFEQAIGRS